MIFFINILKGVAIGAGCILPGISSGVLCVIFGIYERLIDSIIGLFNNFKNNVKFLFPITIGIFIGVVLFGNILKYLFNYFEVNMKFIFAGLILGCIPSLFKQIDNSKTFRLHFLFYTLLAFFISLFLIFLENNMHFIYTFDINFFYLFICGFFMAIGVVFPGVSSTVILMCLGVYNLYLESVSSLNLTVLIPMGLGLAIGGLFFLNVIKLCMKKFWKQTMYCIIGFVFSSTVVLIPSISYFSFTNIFLFSFGLLVSLCFEKINCKKEN